MNHKRVTRSTDDPIPDNWLLPGTILRAFWGPGNSHNGREHIRAIVDNDQIVYRTWSNRKGWHYRIDSRYWFDIRYADGILTRIGIKLLDT